MQSRLSKCWLRLLLFAAYVLIIGCGEKNNMPFPRCISADYFGPEPITVSAHFSSDDEAFIPEGSEGPFNDEIGDFNYGFHHNQVVRWKDTGLRTNGDNLVVRVNGAWTSWSNNNHKESKGNYSLPSLEQLRYATKFEGGEWSNSLPDFHLVCNDYKPSGTQEISSNPNSSCSVNCKCLNEDNSTSTVSRGAPCWFTNGHGAYLLFKKDGDGDNPNEDLKTMRSPKGPTIHLGYNSVAEDGSGVFTLDRNSDKIKNGECDTIKLEDMKGWKIYVKILDRYYLDNAGGYSFEFLGGVHKPSSFGFFDDTYKYLKNTLLIAEKKDDTPAAAQAVFKGIAENSTSFHNFVRSLLVLFVVISSLLYLFAMIQDTKHDLILRMMKITLVVVLISPGSFEFFYNHFLILFVKGLEQLISIITNFSPNSDPDPDRVFSFIEDMFNKFFADSVWKKFTAFFHYQMWASIFMIPAIFIGIVLYFLLCLYAFIIFLSGFVGIAFLIAIMPLFLISILFSQLKSLFEGWIKFCISFCLQSIMIFALLSLLAAIIMNTFYRQLGFTVCYNKWLEIRLCAPKQVFGGFCIIDKQYFSWTPGQIFVPYTVGEASPLSIDKSMDKIESISREGGTIKFTGGAGYIPLPPYYTEKGFRYIDYPFFNPVPGTEKNPADHYIAESDIVIVDKVDKSKKCDDEELRKLVRLTNSLSHAVEKFDILLFINNIDKEIDIDEKIKELYCKQPGSKDQCYKEIIDNYRKGILPPDLKGEIKSFVREVVKSSPHCRLEGFGEVNEKYQDNSDYKRVQDIQRGYLINAGEIVILFLLSFLMFSLRKFVQETASSLAGGGYSVYSISSMYQGGGILSQIPLPFKIGGKNISLMDAISLSKQGLQGLLGGGLEYLGKGITGLPNRLAGGTAHLLGRIPIVGGVFEQAINIPRKLIDTTIEATKFATSPKNDVDKFEEEMYAIFKDKGIRKLKDKFDRDSLFAHRRIDRYLKYYQGCVGSHLGYTIEDAMKFTLEHGRDSLGKEGYKDNLLYRAKEHRKAFLEKLHDYTIGRKREPQRHEEDDNQSNESLRKNSDESSELLRTSAPPSEPSLPHESVIRSTPSVPSSRTTRRSPKRRAPSPPVGRGLPRDPPVIREPDAEGDEE